MVGLERGGNEDKLRLTIDKLKTRITELESENKGLKIASKTLDRLIDAGVDNWEGYDYAMSE